MSVRTPPDLPGSLALWAKLKKNPNLCQTRCTRIGGKLRQTTSSAAAAFTGTRSVRVNKQRWGRRSNPQPPLPPQPLEVLRVQRRSAEHSRERCSVCRLACLRDRTKGRVGLRGRVTCVQRHRLRDVCALYVSFHPALVGGEITTAAASLMTRTKRSAQRYHSDSRDEVDSQSTHIVCCLLLQSRTESLN